MIIMKVVNLEKYEADVFRCNMGLLMVLHANLGIINSVYYPIESTFFYYSKQVRFDDNV